MRLKLTVAYDGSEFAGWQCQPGGGTVQDALQTAVKKLTGLQVAVHGAGRTDAGVHAIAQCAHVDVGDSRLPLSQWPAALNAHLPRAVRVMAVRRVPETFHARYSAKGKIYRYTIWNAPVMPPLENKRAWHVPHAIDLDVLAEVCHLFEGRHNFSAFSAKRAGGPDNTVRTIASIRLRKTGPRIEITFRGEGFLYKMIRMLTAAAVRCSTGRMSPADIPPRLADGSPKLHHVAPADGLILVRVLYSAAA